MNVKKINKNAHSCDNCSLAEGATVCVELPSYGMYFCNECFSDLKALELPKEPRFKIEQRGKLYCVLDTDDIEDKALAHMKAQDSAAWFFTKEQAEKLCELANEVWG